LQGSTLTVDVNPAIPVEVRVEAGKLRVSRMKASIKAHVDIGTLIVDDFEGEIDLSVESGTVRASGVVVGRSCVSCELGKVAMRVAHGSDVRVNAHSTLGSVSVGSVDGARHKRVGVGSVGEFELGSAKGELDIRVECGSINVEAGR
jgi:hypothetical protein